ncbi:hypothetical protein D3OALGA1CA_5049 [Olavius algarvensis associated proteobacterium Delta 3]|nr:hypothetical protein D3OALGA1CA_5049 [Olavius algarvensis associated proteobacterium Delta 3]
MNRYSICIPILLIIGISVGVTGWPSDVSGAIVFSRSPKTVDGSSSISNENEQLAIRLLTVPSAPISVVRWWGTYDDPDVLPTVDDFVIEFYGDQSGLPGDPLATFNVGDDVLRLSAGFQDFLGRSIFEFEAVLPSAFTPDSGTFNYLSIYNTALVGNDFAWHESTTKIPPGIYFNYLETGWMTLDLFDRAVELDAVPLPPSAVLLASSLFVLGWARLRAKAGRGGDADQLSE